MNYDAETNGKTIGKIVSRNQITKYFVDLAQELGVLKTFTLPAEKGVQERELHEALTISETPFAMDCIELTDSVFEKVAPDFQMENMRYQNVGFDEAIHRFQQHDNFHNAIWFDACGYYKSFVRQFIEACQYNLDEQGLAFFTAKVTSRDKGENMKYLFDYYKQGNQITPDEVTNADLVKVYKEFLQSRLPDLDVFYDLTYTSDESGHSFVVFGVSKGLKMRKKSRVIVCPKKKEAPKKPTQWEMVNVPLTLALSEEGVMYKEIATYFGVQKAAVSKKMLSLGYITHRKPLNETITIKEALKLDAIKALLPKPKPKEDKTMNAKIANQVLRLTQQGHTSEAIAQEIGQSKMQVAGIKASISRGTYGDTKKQALAKAKQRSTVLSMLDAGKSDEKIIAKLGISNSALGSYKARRTMRG